MPRKDTFHGFGTFYALGNKFEVRVEYTQDLDGGIILEAADLIGIFLDKDTNGSMDHCACCGRKLTSQPVYVEVIDGGSQVADSLITELDSQLP